MSCDMCYLKTVIYSCPNFFYQTREVVYVAYCCFCVSKLNSQLQLTIRIIFIWVWKHCQIINRFFHKKGEKVFAIKNKNYTFLVFLSHSNGNFRESQIWSVLMINKWGATGIANIKSRAVYQMFQKFLIS